MDTNEDKHPKRKTTAERWLAAEVEAHGGQLNPFFGTPFFDAVQSANKVAPVIEKLLALVAGRQNPDPAHAPSLQPLMNLSRQRRTLAQALHDMRTGAPGSWDRWLRPFDMHPRSGNPTHVAVNIGADNRHEKLFVRAFGENWRAVVAADADHLLIDLMFDDRCIGSAFAVFYVDWPR